MWLPNQERVLVSVSNLGNDGVAAVGELGTADQVHQDVPASQAAYLGVKRTEDVLISR